MLTKFPKPNAKKEERMRVIIQPGYDLVLEMGRQLRSKENQ